MNFQNLLQLMVNKRASDMFVTAGLEICFKVDGVIQPITANKLSASESQTIVFNIMNEAQRSTFEATNECNFAIRLLDQNRFRVSAFRQQGMTGMVLRRIQNQIPSAEELALPSILNELVMAKRGLILFVGATGTGKSTSLASMIKYRNENSHGHIITIEDPIEYVHQHAGCVITQREVGVDTDSFDVALKNTLRQAPDVILIGEIRTRQTMEYAVVFAETGHLCLATLHANNANQALDRIINFFPTENHAQILLDLSLNLRAVIAQQLLRRVDGGGRYPAIEILINTPLAADYIRRGDILKLKELMKNSRVQGMQTFDQALFTLYQKGIISLEDAIISADSKTDLKLMIKLAEGGSGIGKYAGRSGDMELVTN